MIVREWPVDEIHIHIIALKILNALVAGFLYSSVHVVPYLCHDKKILTLYNTFVKSVLKYLADLMLVSVACGTVKHTVATADRACNSCSPEGSVTFGTIAGLITSAIFTSPFL